MSVADLATRRRDTTTSPTSYYPGQSERPREPFIFVYSCCLLHQSSFLPSCLEYTESHEQGAEFGFKWYHNELKYILGDHNVVILVKRITKTARHVHAHVHVRACAVFKARRVVKATFLTAILHS